MRVLTQKDLDEAKEALPNDCIIFPHWPTKITQKRFWSSTKRKLTVSSNTLGPAATMSPNQSKISSNGGHSEKVKLVYWPALPVIKPFERRYHNKQYTNKS